MNKRLGVLLGALALGALVLVGYNAHAQQLACNGTDVVAADAAGLCWTNATTDINGVTLPATGVGSLKTTRIQRARMATPTSSCDFAAPADAIETKDFAPTTTNYQFTALADGRHCFRIRHVNNEGLLSDWTAAVYKVTVRPPAKPKPPSGVTVY